MDACLHCGHPIESLPGKRKRNFCSNLCRQKQWHKDRAAKIRAAKEAGVWDAIPNPIQPSVARMSVETTQRYIPPPTPKISPYEAFAAEILKTTYSGDLQKVMKEVNDHPDLGAVNKAKLRAIADNHRINFTN